jgi:hypothetical protein
MIMVETIARVRECTEQEGAQWRDGYTEGYRVGRGDALCSNGWPHDGWLIPEIPAEVPGENGAQYVTRHVSLARQIGYTSAWRYYSTR